MDKKKKTSALTLDFKGITDVMEKGSLDDIEFPIKAVVKREGSDEVLTEIYLPSSGPDINCHVHKTLGRGDYVMRLVMRDGTEGMSRNLKVENDDRKCPFINHC